MFICPSCCKETCKKAGHCWIMQLGPKSLGPCENCKKTAVCCDCHIGPVRAEKRRRNKVPIRRFLRRLKNRIKACFHFREMWSWEDESCERCGACYRVVYEVLDSVWYVVYGSDGGLLCLDCFLALASEKGIVITPDHFKWLRLLNRNKPACDIIPEGVEQDD